MHFGENQLSRSLIGLSPLPTAHPLSFQPKWVRSSTQSYLRFNLAMGRSLRFGSRPSDSIALFGLAFATASPHGLTSPLSTNSQAHSSKGTPSPHKEAPTDCRHTVSGSISLPSRGTFHLSLTGFLGPRATWDDSLEFAPFRLRGLHPLCRAFQCPSTMTRIFDSMPACQSRPRGPTTPNMQRLTAITHARFSL